MTVSYATGRFGFLGLLFRWNGSVWRLIGLKLLSFLGIYAFLSFLYRFMLDEPGKRSFERLAKYCDEATVRVPITFVLGFFVSQMVSRWWDQFQFMPWTDRLMLLVSSYYVGLDEEIMLIRQRIARYVNLSIALAFRQISIRVLKRFPTNSHLVKTGLLTEQERGLLESCDAPYARHFVPMIWACNMISEHRDTEKITAFQCDKLIGEIDDIREKLHQLLIYDWMSVPLVYTQVATVAALGYFAFCTMGRQYIFPPDQTDAYPDYYIPFFTILEFFFYIGWLSVAEELANPFGEDDEDFEMNFLLDRNVQVSYMIAHNLHGQFPEPEPDPLSFNAARLNHTNASVLVNTHDFQGHLHNFRLSERQAAIISPEQYNRLRSGATQRFTSAVQNVIMNRKNVSQKEERDMEKKRSILVAA